MALLHRPCYWRDLDRLRKDLELEAVRDYVVANNLAMLQVHTELLDCYW